MPESLPSTLHLLGPGIFLFLEFSFKNPVLWHWVHFPYDFEGVESDIRKGKNGEGGVGAPPGAGCVFSPPPASKQGPSPCEGEAFTQEPFRTLDRFGEGPLDWRPSTQLLDVTGPWTLRCCLSTFPTAHLDSQWLLGAPWNCFLSFSLTEPFPFYKLDFIWGVLPVCSELDLRVTFFTLGEEKAAVEEWGQTCRESDVEGGLEEPLIHRQQMASEDGILQMWGSRGKARPPGEKLMSQPGGEGGGWAHARGAAGEGGIFPWAESRSMLPAAGQIHWREHGLPTSLSITWDAPQGPQNSTKQKWGSDHFRSSNGPLLIRHSGQQGCQA